MPQFLDLCKGDDEIKYPLGHGKTVVGGFWFGLHIWTVKFNARFLDAGMGMTKINMRALCHL